MNKLKARGHLLEDLLNSNDDPMNPKVLMLPFVVIKDQTQTNGIIDHSTSISNHY